MAAAGNQEAENNQFPTSGDDADSGANLSSSQVLNDNGHQNLPGAEEQNDQEQLHRPTTVTVEESAPIELDNSDVATVVEVELDLDLGDNDSIGSAAASASAIPIPSFVNDLCVRDASPDVIRVLALKLDLHWMGTAHNWETLAARLGMSLDQIRYLRERCVHPTSPTVELLHYFSDVNLGYLLRLLRDELKRFDVLVDLEPYIMSLQANAVKKHLSRSDTMDSGISGPINDEPGPSHRPDPQSYAQNRVRHNLFHLQRNDPSNAFLNQHPAAIHPNAQQFAPTIAPVQRPALPQNATREFLVTFYPDDEHHTKYVKWLCKNLQKHGANVTREDKLIEAGAGDFTGALTDAFNKAHQIIVVLSDEYTRCVRPKTEDGGPALSQRAQSCRYLYRLMDAEYLTNSCVNYRFRPVLFPFVPSTAVPSGWVRNTILYQWPAQQDALFRMLFESASSSDGRFDDLASDSNILMTT
uniref:SEFIR domain-containing protein n=1 Tax=Plectus sambesii TaxID=2011161 RepID=A0A914VVX9_9BILA